MELFLLGQFLELKEPKMKLVDESNIEKYKEFLESHDRCDFQQGPEWSKVKSFWKNEIIIIENDEGEITASVSVLIRKIPMFGNLMYASRGPVCDVHNTEVMKEITESLKKLAKKYNAFVLKIEPDIKSDDKEFRKIVEDLKYKIKDDAKNFSEEIQPRYVFRLDIKDKTEEEILAGFHQKTRYNIRVATKKGVVIKEGTREDLKYFHEIMIVTRKKRQFYNKTIRIF